MAASGPGQHDSTDDPFLSVRHDQELQRLRQKQHDEWLALLEFQNRERDSSWGQLQFQTQSTFSRSHLDPRLTPAPTETTHTTTRDGVVYISSDGEDDSTTTQAPSVSAGGSIRRTSSQYQSLSRKDGREKSPLTQSATERTHSERDSEQQVASPSQPATGRHTKERIDIRRKRQQVVARKNDAVDEPQKELGKIKANAVLPADNSRSTIDTPVNVNGSKSSGTPMRPRTQSRVPPLDRDSSPEIPLSVLRKQQNDRDSSPEIPLAVFRKQQNDRSTILKDPKKVARDPQLLALQQKKKTGLFSKNILHNKRSEAWASTLGSVFQAPAQHVPLVIIQSTGHKENKRLLVKMKCRPERLRAIAQHTISKNRQRAVMADQARHAAAGETRIAVSSIYAHQERLNSRGTGTQGPARLSSCTSIPRTSDQASANGSKEPAAASPIKVPIKYASQFTSSRDILANIREQRERETSVASRYPIFSNTTSVPSPRKRKNVKYLSDDSDFAPSEPPSVGAKEKNTTPKSGVAMAKPKVKDDYSFKAPQTPLSKSSVRDIPPTPATPAAKKQKFTPQTPESPLAKAIPPLPSRNSNMFPPPGSRLGRTTQSSISRFHRPMRGAAAQASRNIQDLAFKTEEFWTEEANRQANEEEATYITPKAQSKEQMEAIQNRFRSMSMTPAPSGIQESEYEEDGVEDRVHGTEDWMKERFGGDRYVSKGRYVPRVRTMIHLMRML